MPCDRRIFAGVVVDVMGGIGAVVRLRLRGGGLSEGDRDVIALVVVMVCRYLLFSFACRIDIRFTILRVRKSSNAAFFVKNKWVYQRLPGSPNNAQSFLLHAKLMNSLRS